MYRKWLMRLSEFLPQEYCMLSMHNILLIAVTLTFQTEFLTLPSLCMYFVILLNRDRESRRKEKLRTRNWRRNNWILLLSHNYTPAKQITAVTFIWQLWHQILVPLNSMRVVLFDRKGLRLHSNILYCLLNWGLKLSIGIKIWNQRHVTDSHVLII